MLLTCTSFPKLKHDVPVVRRGESESVFFLISVNSGGGRVRQLLYVNKIDGVSAAEMTMQSTGGLTLRTCQSQDLAKADSLRAEE